MKQIVLFLLSASFFIFSCTSSKKITTDNSVSAKRDISQPKQNEDGLSYETAITIMETSESKGVKAEYEWIKNNYKNYSVESQSLDFNNKKPYDIISIKLSDGSNLKLYFNIANFFGKF